MPGALIRLPAQRGDAEFVVTEVEEGISRALTAERRLRAPPTPWRAVLRTKEASAAALDAGAPLAIFLDLPMTPGATSEADQFRVAARARPWRPQLVYASPEDTGFAQRAQLAQRATIGRLRAALAPGFEGRVDEATTLDVELLDGELASVTRLQMLNGANAAAVKAADGSWEILQFETAEEIAASVWRLSGLLRGQSGTGQAMLAGAEAGAWFVLLDAALVPAGLKPAEAGLTLNWRVGPSGVAVSAERFATQEATGGLRAAIPLSPVHLKAARTEGGDLSVSWIRRGRIDADAWGTGDIPLGEESEAYLVEISAGGEVVRATETADASLALRGRRHRRRFPEPACGGRNHRAPDRRRRRAGRPGEADNHPDLKPLERTFDMTDIKPWYLSRTIWASLITIVTATGGILGLPLAGVDNAALTDTLLQAVTAISGLVAIFGRVGATTRIG